jgi:hypothetical protein
MNVKHLLLHRPYSGTAAASRLPARSDWSELTSVEEVHTDVKMGFVVFLRC